MASDRRRDRGHSHYHRVDGTARGKRDQGKPAHREPAVLRTNKSIEYVSHPIKLYNSI